MRRLLIALVAGVVVAVPAAVGLFGNASFAQRLPLRSPTSAASPSETESPTPSPSPTESEPGDDHGGNRPPGTSDDEPGDDHGGDRPRTGDDDNSGPGSSNSGHGSDDTSADDNSGRGGSDDDSDDSADDSSGHGSDDTTADDSGHHDGGDDAERRHLGPRLGRHGAGTTRVDTDPTTESAPPEQSPAAPAAAGDVSVLADLLADPADPDPGPDLGPDLPEDGPVAPAWVTLGDPGGPERLRAGARARAGCWCSSRSGSSRPCSSSGWSAPSRRAPWPSARPSTTPRRWRACWPRRSSSRRSATRCVAGDPAAIAAFDEVARDQLLSESIVRVKLWSADGRVLYADESQLIGRSFALSKEQREALALPATIADVSDLDESENAFESADRLVEVYRPVWTPSGQELLFEIYASYDPVGARTTQLWRGFAGVTASSLVLFVVIVAPIVWHLVRRLRRAEEQRDRPAPAGRRRVGRRAPPDRRQPARRAGAGARGHLVHRRRGLGHRRRARPARPRPRPRRGRRGRALEHPLAAHPARRHLPREPGPLRGRHRPARPRPDHPPRRPRRARRQRRRGRPRDDPRGPAPGAPGRPGVPAQRRETRRARRR